MIRPCTALLGIVFLIGGAPQEEKKEPRVAVLVPGVTVKRLPVRLTNINSVEYAPDGRLYAAGYDGRIHVLTDTDGDGLEDKATLFWGKKGDLFTPVGIALAKEGLYVAARGKIALLKDTDGDGRADVSETVVSGWVRERHNSANRNDAAGVAIDPEGNLYFSLGCTSYNDAFLLDKQGKPHYSLKSERGTVLKVSPDRKRREIVSTGLRFVVGLAFNKYGDLFATDQEGDTWFPGGNPRDELLHIIPGRHYGFPFRHPKYLPDVVDEPFVVGFSPQHQSSCGFRFNEEGPNQKRFGPDHWEGDAIVTGFSRGKLWRVPLAKTRAGYVGKQVLFATFEGLPTDVAISPKGNLLVTCHSGSPDWGAGPGAEGYLFKVFFDRKAPQPVLAWPSGPLEAKVAFDRPIEASRLGKVTIQTGAFVWEGDRYEWIWPGYKVVKAAKNAPRRSHRVKAARASNDGRTITISTVAHPWRARYAVTIPGLAESRVELSYDLSGTEASWASEGEPRASWRGWLPHVDLKVARTLTRGSAEHEKLWALLKEKGRLTLKSRILLPGKRTFLRFEGTDRFRVKCGEVEAQSNGKAGSRQEAELAVAPGKEPLLLVIELATGSVGKGTNLDGSYHTDQDPHERPLRLEHHLVPWAPIHVPPTERAGVGELGKVTGDPKRGREIFFGSEAKCATCHVPQGGGGRVAADLTVSVGRDPEAVLRDIVDPNAAINPDFVSYVVRLKSGEVLTGVLKSTEKERLRLIDAGGKTHDLSRDEIDDFRASTVSLMPEGFRKLGEKKLRDLVAFLCSEDPERKLKGAATGGILREYWLDIPGGSLSSLIRHPGFPDKPSGSGLLNRFEGPVDWKENYGSRIRGYVHPPKTGEYVFWIAGDDQCELWLSPNEKPAGKVRIAQVERWTRSRDWDAYPSQKSKPIHLEARKRYYIEALQKEGTVADGLAVGWRLPDGTLERPVPGVRLSSPDEAQRGRNGK